MFGVQSNPFREETEMKNKKYLQTKEGSIEAAVVQSVTTESPINPNDAKPTLTLPKKYLSSREGSLESAVQNVMVDESISGNMARDLRALDGHQFQAKYRMTKAHAQRAGSGIQQYGRKGKNPAADMDEQHPGQKKGSAKLKKGWKMTASGEPIRVQSNPSMVSRKRARDIESGKVNPDKMDYNKKEEVEIDESWKKVKPTDKVQRLHQLSISGWLAKQMGVKGDPHRFNHRVPSIYFDDVDLVVDDKTVVRGALSGNATMADLLKKVQAHTKKNRLRWESVEMDEQQPIVRRGVSTNAAGQKIPWKHTHDAKSGRSSVTDRHGTRDVTVKRMENPKQALRKRPPMEDVEIDEKQTPGKGYKLPRQLKDKNKEKMVGVKDPRTGKVHTKVVDKDDPRYTHAPLHASVDDDRGVGSQAYTDYIRNLTPGEPGVKDKDSKESSSASKQASMEKKRQVTRIDDAVDPEIANIKKTASKGIKDMKIDTILKVAQKKADNIAQQNNSLDIGKILASQVNEEIIVGLLDMGIIQVNENTETGFEVINDPVANRENLLRMAYNTGAEILDEYTVAPKPTETSGTVSGMRKAGYKLKKTSKERRSRGGHYDKPDTATYSKTRGPGASFKLRGASKRKRASASDEKAAAKKADVTKRGLAYAASEYVPQGTAIDEVSSTKSPEKKWGREASRSIDPETGYPGRIHGGVAGAKTAGPKSMAVARDRTPHDAARGKKKVRGAKEEVEIDEKDSRRTVDAIRAYDRSKDASRDADWDTLHGKAKRGDIEKKYAKKERGEIDKDDPRWKHRDYHTGMHGEEVSYHDQLMDEADKWIQKAIKKPGALRKQLGVPEGEKIPKSKLDAAAKEGGKLGQRARLAKTLSKMN